MEYVISGLIAVVALAVVLHQHMKSPHSSDDAEEFADAMAGVRREALERRKL
jgi:hypothetical protein